MALAYISMGNIIATTGSLLITGLSTDVKPAAPLPTWVFIEADTGEFFIVISGVWTATTTIPNGSIDLLTKVTGVLPFANGGISAAAAAPATTGTMTVPMSSSLITITPTGACTFNASGGIAGAECSFIITTSGTTSFVLTWGANFRKVGTLATGTTSGRFFAVTFKCINGTIWQEIARTAAQT